MCIFSLIFFFGNLWIITIYFWYSMIFFFFLWFPLFYHTHSLFLCLSLSHSLTISYTSFTYSNGAYQISRQYPWSDSTHKNVPSFNHFFSTLIHEPSSFPATCVCLHAAFTYHLAYNLSRIKFAIMRTHQTSFVWNQSACTIHINCGQFYATTL